MLVEQYPIDQRQPANERISDLGMYPLLSQRFAICLHSIPRWVGWEEHGYRTSPDFPGETVLQHCEAMDNIYLYEMAVKPFLSREFNSRIIRFMIYLHDLDEYMGQDIHTWDRIPPQQHHNIRERQKKLTISALLPAIYGPLHENGRTIPVPNYLEHAVVFFNEYNDREENHNREALLVRFLDVLQANRFALQYFYNPANYPAGTIDLSVEDRQVSFTRLVEATDLLLPCLCFSQSQRELSEMAFAQLKAFYDRGGFRNEAIAAEKQIRNMLRKSCKTMIQIHPRSCVATALTTLLDETTEMPLVSFAVFDYQIAAEVQFLNTSQTGALRLTLEMIREYLGEDFYVEVPANNSLPDEQKFVACIDRLPLTGEIRKYLKANPQHEIINDAMENGSLLVNEIEDQLTFPKGHAVFCRRFTNVDGTERIEIFESYNGIWVELSAEELRSLVIPSSVFITIDVQKMRVKEKEWRRDILAKRNKRKYWPDPDEFDLSLYL